MLDVFRTLLNFETDDFKLLQLILFGQPEMGKIIHKYPNFEDRISFDFEIGPIALEDMQGMIDHRITVTGGEPGSWFTQKSIKKIHKNQILFASWPFWCPVCLLPSVPKSASVGTCRA